jgi:hypothetical protein
MKNLLIKNVANFLANIWAVFETLGQQINIKRQVSEVDVSEENLQTATPPKENSEKKSVSPTAFKTKTILASSTKKLEDLPDYNLHTLYKTPNKKSAPKRSNT